MGILRGAARHSRVLLVLGLVAGFALPGVAAAIKPYLPGLVAFLIFLSALRIGARDTLGSLSQARAALGWVIVLQLGVPLIGVAVLWGLGWHVLPIGLALLLALSGSSISGSPAFSAMVGRDPAPALRLLILGTALSPLTVIPVFGLSPVLGGFGAVALAALRLTVVIALAVVLAFALRHWCLPDAGTAEIQAIDGLTAIVLATMVVGLMSAVGPALWADPAGLAKWLALAFAVNYGQQILAFWITGQAGASIVAGNRNIALFLVALPAAVTDPILVFIGCYQVPMLLTPILLHRFYAHD